MEKETTRKTGVQKTPGMGIGKGLSQEVIFQAEGFLNKRYPDGIDSDTPEK